MGNEATNPAQGNATQSNSAPSTSARSTAAQNKPYTAVFYFHGMGSQRRLEETSRLVDSLDRYSNRTLFEIHARLEPGTKKPDQTFTYIRAEYNTSSKDKNSKTQWVRFYEVYWAPVMAGQKSALGVLKWMVRQTIRPFYTLRSPWRERQRLRRASLAALYEAGPTARDGLGPDDFSTLAKLYDDFEGPDALRRYPEGSFSQFLTFLQSKTATDPMRTKKLKGLACAWHSRYRKTELRNLFLLCTLALAMLLTGGAAIALIFVILQRLTTFAAGTPLASLAAEAPATWKTALGLIPPLAAFFGISRFLTDYLGDVEVWATYAETSEKHEQRAKVIGIGTDILAQVLEDQCCDRAVLISHSLGTSVAHDTLFSILRNNRARKNNDPIAGPVPLKKIQHFITLGSPIDKIEYFFESYRSQFHRYRRITEYLRGDIGIEPFCRHSKPHIHWINFWDEGDPVSGALRSPTGPRGFVQRVDNVRVASLAYPNPGASHLAYFFNRDVIECIFEVIFKQAWSFQTAPYRPGEERNWESVYIGPTMSAPRSQRIWFGLALFVPWAALVALVIHLLAPSYAFWFWLPSIIAILILIVGYLLSLKEVPSLLR
jgi:hypothetical protein